MRPRKWVVLLIAALAVAATVGVQSVNILIARHREQVQQELQKVLGQDVSFEGLEVNVLGWPAFVAREFRVADDPRFAATPALRARELILGVSVLQLFAGRIVIDSVTLTEPEFQIIIDETGLLNVTELMNQKSQSRRLPRLKPPAAVERRRNSVNFSVTTLRVENGRIEYLDRSIKQPAELRVKNIALTVKGLDPGRTTRVSIAAALTEGVGPDVRLDGEFKPAADVLSWLHREIDFSVRLDSLYLPVVARAIAGLRDKIPSQLDVTGPMAFQANLRGTAQRPRLEDIDLKIPLFASSDYNARINGRVEFSEQRSWDDAKLQGRMTVEPISLSQLRRLRVFEEILPAMLTAEGSIGLYSRFEGTWENLRIGALLRADKADLRYRDWLRKPAKRPAAVTARIVRRKNTVQFLDSELAVGSARMEFSGRIDQEPSPRVRFKLRARTGPLTAWNQFLIPAAYRGVAGSAECDLLIDGPVHSFDENGSIAGELKLAGASFERRDSGRRLDKLDVRLFFTGKQARIDDARFRWGTSSLALSGTVTNLFDPRLTFQARSADVQLADLVALNEAPPVRLRDVSAAGEIGFDNDRLTFSGAVVAAQAQLQPFDFVNLRADVALSPAGLTFKNLTAQTWSGALRADGYWASADEHSRQFQVDSQFDAIQVRGLLAQWLPQIKDRIEGQLTGRARFDASAADGTSLRDAIKGSGETLVRRGVIKNFNLIGQLLRRGDATNPSPDAASRLSAGFAGVVNRADTPFDSLKANFTIQNGRLHTDNLVLTTPEYAVTGAGWVALDRSTKWNGMIVLSPRLTQELQRDYRIIRYLLDRRGRLSIAFRVEGTIPDVKVRLENRALAQALRAGPPSRGDDADSSGKQDQEPRERKHWLPDALDRILKR